jgi:hypothetical protein
MTRDVDEQPPRPTSPNLLGLPPHLRRRTYLYTGIARFDGHRYTYYLDGRTEKALLHVGL